MPPRPASRLLILGWDAADWCMIHQRFAVGGMPHLQALLQRGSQAPLSTLEPKLSPLLWTSVATGMTADKHGILHFIEPDPSGGPVRISASTTRRTKALWNILSQSGMRTHVVNWYASHPAEPITGSVVSNLFLEGHAAPGQPPSAIPHQAVFPPTWRDRIAPCRVPVDQLPDSDLAALVPNWRQLAKDPHIPLLRQHLARCRSVHQAGLTALADETAWDCVMIFQEAIDTVGHHFMQFHPPQMKHVGNKDFRHFKNVMDNLYDLHDRMLGELLQAAGPEITVILLSDHGFHSGSERPVTEGLSPEQRAATEALWHREHGILVLAGPGVIPSASLCHPSLLDITPTALALLGCPMGSDMDGRVLTEALTHPAPAPIPSWDTLHADAGLHPPELRQNPFDANDAIRQLVALGYLAALPEGNEARLNLVRDETQFNLAMVHTSRGRPRPAATILTELVSKHPTEPRYVFNLVTNLLNLAQPGPCIEALRHFLAVFPTHPDALQQLAAAHLAAGDLPAARAALSTETVPDGNAASRANRLGDLHLLAGNPLVAREMFQLAHARDPADPAAITGLAKVDITEGHFEAAAGHCLDALEINHEHAEAHHQLGVALAWLNSLDHALLSFQSALALQPGRIETLRFLELIHLQRTENSAAAAYHQTLETMLSDFDSAQRAIILRTYPMGSESWAEQFQ